MVNFHNKLILNSIYETLKLFFLDVLQIMSMALSDASKTEFVPNLLNYIKGPPFYCQSCAALRSVCLTNLEQVRKFVLKIDSFYIIFLTKVMLKLESWKCRKWWCILFTGLFFCKRLFYLVSICSGTVAIIAYSTNC